MLTRKSRHLLLITSIFFLAGVFFVTALAAHAQVSIDLPTNFAGFSSQDLKTTIQNIVRIVLGFTGFIFLLLVLYGGLVWMTSQGERDKIDRAKKIISSAVIGLVLTLSSYAIAQFVINQFSGAVGPNNGGSGGTGGPGGFGFALGAGVLESHYPGRNATDVPRNTNIFITFKEAMDVTTLCTSGGNVNISNVEITDVNDTVTPDPLDPDSNNILDTVTCAATDATNKIIKLDPGGASTNYLGISNGNTLYKVILKSGIKTAAGQSALPLGYSWQFTVSSVIDLTPPTIVSVIPDNLQTTARNTLVDINFSEAVDPSTASGFTNAAPPFTNITLSNGATAVSGSYNSTNQYKTTEFVSNDLCGQNSCGGNVYCLPGSATISGVVTAGVKDMAGNLLDGEYTGTFPSGNGTAGGNFAWSFLTTNTIDLKAPMMTARIPASNTTAAGGALLTDPVEMTFNKLLSASSLNTTNVGFGRAVPYPGIPVSDDIHYWISKQDLDGPDPDTVLDHTKVYINHDAYKPMTVYHPGASSEVKDINQNCYFPPACDTNGDGVADPCP